MTNKHITIDGSQGEGGGQILRSALSLSMITGLPVTLKNIRAGRKKPGLMRQHLTCARAAAEICDGDIGDIAVGASELTFMPGKVKAGDYHFSIGTAGSTTLVAQTVIPALMLQDQPSTIRLEGGTHNMKCPPYDFIEQCFLPVLRRMGIDISCDLQRYGFYPAGGGMMSVHLGPAQKLTPIEMINRGDEKSLLAEALISKIQVEIAERELKVVGRRLGWPEDQLKVCDISRAISPGNILLLKLEFEEITEIVSGFGAYGISAENVAKNACKAANRYLNSEAVVGPYLADQLLLPMALAGRGQYTTLRPSLHLKTNIAVIRKFLDVEITLKEIKPGLWLVNVGS